MSETLDNKFTNDLDSIARRPRKRTRLQRRDGSVAIPSIDSFGTGTDEQVGGSGGIASPLQEQTGLDPAGASVDRTFHAVDHVVTSSDGFFTFVFNNVETINFLDDAGASVEMNFVDVDPDPTPAP